VNPDQLAALVDAAYADGLSGLEVDRLLDKGEPQVAQALAANSTLSAPALARVADRFPSLSDLVGHNPAAPPELKDYLPIGELAGASLQRYLTDRRATIAQSIAVLAAADEAPAGGGPLLRDVWSRASNRST